MNPDAQLDQVEDLGVQRDASLEVVQLEVDLIDLDDRDVEDDIGLVGVADFPRVHKGVVLIHLFRPRLLAALIADWAFVAATAIGALALLLALAVFLGGGSLVAPAAA